MCPANQSSTAHLIAEEDFRVVVQVRAEALLSLAGLVSKLSRDQVDLTRPLLGQLLSQSTQVEELLDTYGARNNQRWRRFRAPVAAIKRFSQVQYEMLHIGHSLEGYCLPEVEGDFPQQTTDATDLVRRILSRACCEILLDADRLGLRPVSPASEEDFVELLPPGRLPNDRSRRKVDSAAEVVTRLATAFLNLAAQADVLSTALKLKAQDYARCVPDPISEESLRSVQHRFHNLQSLYDTFVSDSETECLDPHLPTLRGHISVIFHLLHIGTNLAHYYERHMIGAGNGDGAEGTRFVESEPLLSALMNYCCAFACRFLEHGRRLSQRMLSRYAEVASVDVPIPRYRGFHVRPSTLLAKIVMHYGSDVRLEMDGETYDAGSPLEIFRVNERINAQKRKWLSGEIGQLPLSQWVIKENGDVGKIIHDVLSSLAEQGKLVIYEQPLDTSQIRTRAECPSLMEQIVEEVARLQATGRIDIHADMTVRITGDKRVLDDIRILAQNGYGEDNFGNNIALPKELSYLRR